MGFGPTKGQMESSLPLVRDVNPVDESKWIGQRLTEGVVDPALNAIGTFGRENINRQVIAPLQLAGAPIKPLAPNQSLIAGVLPEVEPETMRELLEFQDDPEAKKAAEALSGVYTSLKQGAEGVATAEMGTLMAAGATPIGRIPITASFFLQMAGRAPEAVKRTYDIVRDPKTSVFEKTKSITDLIQHGVMLTLVGGHLAKQATAPGKTPAISEEAKLKAVSLGMDPQSVQIMGDFSKTYGITPEITTDSKIFPDANKIMAASGGKVFVHPERAAQLWYDLPEQTRAADFHSRLYEELVHTNQKPGTGIKFLEALTELERMIGNRLIRRKFKGAREGFEMSDEDMGIEFMRWRMQRLAKLTPGEIHEAIGKEKWTLKSLDAVDQAIQQGRKILGKNAELESYYRDVEDGLNFARTAMAEGGTMARTRIEKDREQRLLTRGAIQLPETTDALEIKKTDRLGDIEIKLRKAEELANLSPEEQQRLAEKLNAPIGEKSPEVVRATREALAKMMTGEPISIEERKLIESASGRPPVPVREGLSPPLQGPRPISDFEKDIPKASRPTTVSIPSDAKFSESSTKNQGIVELQAKEGFKKFFTQQGTTTGVTYTMGYKAGSKTAEVQAIKFDKRKFSEEQAREWLANNTKQAGAKFATSERFSHPSPEEFRKNISATVIGLREEAQRLREQGKISEAEGMEADADWLNTKQPPMQLGGEGPKFARSERFQTAEEVAWMKERKNKLAGVQAKIDFLLLESEANRTLGNIGEANRLVREARSQANQFPDLEAMGPLAKRGKIEFQPHTMDDVKREAGDYFKNPSDYSPEKFAVGLYMKYGHIPVESIMDIYLKALGEEVRKLPKEGLDTVIRKFGIDREAFGHQAFSGNRPEIPPPVPDIIETKPVPPSVEQYRARGMQMSVNQMSIANRLADELKGINADIAHADTFIKLRSLSGEEAGLVEDAQLRRQQLAESAEILEEKIQRHRNNAAALEQKSRDLKPEGPFPKLFKPRSAKGPLDDQVKLRQRLEAMVIERAGQHEPVTMVDALDFNNINWASGSDAWRVYEDKPVDPNTIGLELTENAGVNRSTHLHKVGQHGTAAEPTLVGSGWRAPSASVSKVVVIIQEKVPQPGKPRRVWAVSAYRDSRPHRGPVMRDPRLAAKPLPKISTLIPTPASRFMTTPIREMVKDFLILDRWLLEKPMQQHVTEWANKDAYMKAFGAEGRANVLQAERGAEWSGPSGPEKIRAALWEARATGKSLSEVFSRMEGDLESLSTSQIEDARIEAKETGKTFREVIQSKAKESGEVASLDAVLEALEREEEGGISALEEGTPGVRGGTFAGGPGMHIVSAMLGDKRSVSGDLSTAELKASYDLFRSLESGQDLGADLAMHVSDLYDSAQSGMLPSGNLILSAMRKIAKRLKEDDPKLEPEDLVTITFDELYILSKNTDKLAEFIQIAKEAHGDPDTSPAVAVGRRKAVSDIRASESAREARVQAEATQWSGLRGKYPYRHFVSNVPRQPSKGPTGQMGLEASAVEYQALQEAKAREGLPGRSTISEFSKPGSIVQEVRAERARELAAATEVRDIKYREAAEAMASLMRKQKPEVNESEKVLRNLFRMQEYGAVTEKGTPVAKGMRAPSVVKARYGRGGMGQYYATSERFLDAKVKATYELFRLGGDLSAHLSRRDLQNRIPILVQGAENAVGAYVQAARGHVILASVEGSLGKRSNKAGASQVRSAATAIRASMRDRVEGFNPPVVSEVANRPMLDNFLALSRMGQRKAQNWVSGSEPDLKLGQDFVGFSSGFDRRTRMYWGRKWLKEAQANEAEVLYAIQHFNDEALQNTARAIGKEFHDNVAFERAAGSNIQERQGYVGNIVEGELWNDRTISWPERMVNGKSFWKPKVFNNPYEAISQGPYIRITHDAAEAMALRIKRGRTAAAVRRGIEILKDVNDPATGKPVAMAPELTSKNVQVEDPRTGEVRTERRPDYSSPSPDYTLVWPGGKANTGMPIAIRNGYVRSMEWALHPSVAMNIPVIRQALITTRMLKHSWLLLFDTFHPGRLGQYAMASGGNSWFDPRTGYRGGLSSIQYRVGDLDTAVKQGLVSRRAADWAKGEVRWNLDGGNYETITRAEMARRLASMGTNFVHFSDALMKDAVKNIPIIGPLAFRYNRWLFDRFVPGLMAESSVRNLERLMAAYPKESAARLVDRVRLDMNTMYGNMGKQGIFKNQTFRDLAQILAFAPMWEEGLIMKEARFAGRLATRPAQYVAGQAARALPGTRDWGERQVTSAKLGMGPMGRAMGRGLVGWLVLTQMLNLMSRKKFTWENEEEDRKMDAWVPLPWAKDETDGFWLPTLNIFGEVTHKFTKNYRNSPNVAAALARTAASFAGPIAKAMEVMWTQRSPVGEVQTTTGAVVGEALKTGVGSPLTIGIPLQSAGHLAAPGIIPAPQKSDIVRRIGSLMGFKLEPGQTYLRKFSDIAGRYVKDKGLEKKSGWKFEPTDDPSYHKMRKALELGDEENALKIYRELLKDRTEQDVFDAMDLWLDRPFTGSLDAEDQLLSDLDANGRELHYRALLEKEKLYEGFMMMVLHAESPR